MVKHRNAIATLEPYVPGRPISAVKEEFKLSRVVKLASNENPRGCSYKAREAAIDAIAQTALYPDGACSALRTALSLKFGVKESQLIFGAGADEVISMIAKVYVNEGDECITASCTFSQYEAACVSMGGKMVFAPLTPSFGFDLSRILSLVGDKTKVIFLCNPNNPTGSVYPAEEQAAFLDQVPENVLVVIDEAYGEFAGDAIPNTIDEVNSRENVILIKTFSKIYGLAAMRVGYGIGSEGVIKPFENIRCPFNVTTAAQAAALAALEDAAFTRSSAQLNALTRGFYQKRLDYLGIKYVPSYANFVLTDVNMDSNEAFAALMRRGYITRSGAALGVPGWLRVTMGDQRDMGEFLNELRDVISK